MKDNLFDLSSVFGVGYRKLYFDADLNLWYESNGSYRRYANQHTFPSTHIFATTLGDLRKAIVRNKKFREYVASNSEPVESGKSGDEMFIVVRLVEEESIWTNTNPTVFKSLAEARDAVSELYLPPWPKVAIFQCVARGQIDDVIWE